MKENTCIQYCIRLQDTQRQQRQRIIRKLCMNITNVFMTKLSILLLTPSKIWSTNIEAIYSNRAVVFESVEQAGRHRLVESTRDTFRRWLWYWFTHFRASTTFSNLQMWDHQFGWSSQSVEVIFTRKIACWSGIALSS